MISLDHTPRGAVVPRLLALVLVTSCSIPRDTEHTLERVRGHELRVGVTDHPPLVDVVGERVIGVEAELVRELGRRLNARVTFRAASESELFDALHRGELDLIAAGLSGDAPWTSKAAFTKPWRTDEDGTTHVLAAPLGENAWLVEIETFLRGRQQGGAPRLGAAE